MSDDRPFGSHLLVGDAKPGAMLAPELLEIGEAIRRVAALAMCIFARLASASDATPANDRTTQGALHGQVRAMVLFAAAAWHGGIV